MIKRTLLSLQIALLFCGLGLLLPTFSKAQEAPVNPMDTLTQSVIKQQADIDALKKLKISGYIQAQYQVADSVAAPSFAGGNFNANSDKRFNVRRGRIKFAYEANMTQFVMQVDVTEKGVGIKDAYGKVTEPWLKTFSLSAGVMNRPFGYEIGYSSSSRETPERGRMSQIIFPGERDLGAMITIHAPKTSPLSIVKLEAGMFNGTGGTAVDFDKEKDFIGHLSFAKSLMSEKIKLSGGLSYYNGLFRNGFKKIYTDGTDSKGIHAFVVDSASDNALGYSWREYRGVDIQASFAFPFGITTIRGEYIMGHQPGTSTNSVSPSTQPATSIYRRDFDGAYVYFLQNIFQTKHQLVVKYDWYDPNTNVGGTEIGAKDDKGKTISNFTVGDIKYTTLGIGWNYYFNNNVKFMFYYDMVTNETTSLYTTAGGNFNFKKDMKDNVLTLRVQYKF